ncbi:hypothetical protein D7Y15_31095 [Corallococcus sp. AB030]|uniref:hypothetical protein n=1 Tax=Corallococcus TaxID=83461 RepID=UPI000EA23B12|nr:MULTISPECIES: hypothetical protein [Corallococcus]NRD55576.1 hypothetical protein [Corallococcus exiguus]RKH18086.1 hypothetical protein D7V77_34720 [Corallococcus sp. CA041A]RKI06321.1 hypothetical protein D7Y15_31095 [Corallococcus sp. AB030]
MKRFKNPVLALSLSVGALLWAPQALAAGPSCERRCADDKAKFEKVCKEKAKNAIPYCMKVAGQARDKCMNQCRTGKKGGGDTKMEAPGEEDAH